MKKELKLLFGSRFISEKEKFGNIRDLVNHIKEEDIYPRFSRITTGVNEPECEIDGKKYIVFCANNYLSLSENSKVKEAAKRAIDKYGIGPGGSRVISGNVDIIEDLEEELANLVGTEDCLTFPTGYMANIAVFKGVMDTFFMGLPYKNSQGAIFSDEFNHGSIVDGCRLSRVKKVIFKHDDLVDLEAKIKKNNKPNKLIVTEGVFSLDGEIINLPEYIKIAKKYNAKLMIDDAHGVGLLGNRGGGTPEYHKCSKDVDIIMGCMDKTMGGTGGYLCGSKFLIDYLRVSARSSMLSSAIPCGMAGGVIEAIHQIRDGKNIRDQLFKKSLYLRDSLEKLGFQILGKDNIPSVPLLVGNDKKGIVFGEELYKRGFLSPVVRWPAVPKDTSRFRIIIMHNHKKEHIDKFVSASKDIGKKLGVI